MIGVGGAYARRSRLAAVTLQIAGVSGTLPDRRLLSDALYWELKLHDLQAFPSSPEEQAGLCEAVIARMTALRLGGNAPAIEELRAKRKRGGGGA